VWQKINKYGEKNHLRWNVFTMVGILLIIICGIRITHGLQRYMDVLFWDEALYLSRGVQLFDQIPKTWGPSYSLWYKLLSFFVQDRVELYYFNFSLTTILICIAFFLLLLSCGVQRVLAFILSIFFLSTFINMPLWPRVSHFCIIVLIAGIIVAKYQKSLLEKLAVLSIALFVCAYARPEMFLPFIVFFVLTILFFFINIRQVQSKQWLLMAGLTVLVVFVIYFFKTPFNNGDTGRGLRVFLQHYAWNHTEWNHLQNVFWLDFPDIIQQHFKDASSLPAIIQSNPAAFEQHIVSNIANYGIQMGKIFISFFAPVFTKDLHWLCLMVSAMLFIVYFTFTKTSKDKRKRFKALATDNILTLTVLFFFAVPSFMASIYAYPRQHYLLLQVPLLLLLTALAISSVSVEIEKSLQKITVVGAIWFFVTPEAEDFHYFSLFRQEESLCNLKTVRFIKNNFTTKDSVRVFDAEGYMTNLLPSNFTNYNEVYYRNRNIVLSDFLKAHDFDIIYKTPTLTMLNNVQKDTALFNFLRNPEQYGYYEQKTGNFTPVLLLKKKE
jgi:hypothetical protein